MKLLELFCGTKSIGKVFSRNGAEVFSVDFDKQHNPDLCIDILNFDISMLPNGFKPDVIWASPPCTCFSVASMGHHWAGGKCGYIPKTKESEQAIKIVEKTLSIIKELNPKYWFMENPRGMLRKLPIVNGLYRKTITYCQYGDTRMKPTDIWTNHIFWQTRPMCKNGDNCHEKAPRGSRTGTQGISGKINRAIIPEQLCEEIYNSCKRNK